MTADTKIRVIGGIAAAISFAIIGWVVWVERNQNIRVRRRLREAARRREAADAEEWSRLMVLMGEDDS